jgi:hypothetical protein
MSGRAIELGGRRWESVALDGLLPAVVGCGDLIALYAGGVFELFVGLISAGGVGRGEPDHQRGGNGHGWLPR